MSRSLLRQITPLVHRRIQWNQKLLSSAVEELPSESLDAICMTENCIRRLKQLHGKESSAKGKMLRLSVENGGCSGFQYVFLLDDKKNSDDRMLVESLKRMELSWWLTTSPTTL